MKQFLYLDTDIVNSIIAQQEKGLIDSISTEKENGTKKESTKSLKAEGTGEAGGDFWKLAKAEAKFSIAGSVEGSSSKHDTTRKIIAKTLHDASFDMAYNAISPTVVVLGKDEIEPGKYVEMKGLFDFVDLEYLEGLFSKDGIIELMKKNEKEQARRTVAEHEENNMNRDQRRHEGGKLIEKKIHECEKQCDKKYEGIHGIVAAMKSIIPFRKMLVSDDGYLIPVEDKFFRVNPETFGFMYGGEIKCVGMITNIIVEDTDLDDESNIFATLQFSVNKLLRSILPTKEGNMYIVSPIAIYYES